MIEVEKENSRNSSLDDKATADCITTYEIFSSDEGSYTVFLKYNFINDPSNLLNFCLVKNNSLLEQKVSDKKGN